MFLKNLNDFEKRANESLCNLSYYFPIFLFLCFLWRCALVVGRSSIKLARLNQTVPKPGPFFAVTNLTSQEDIPKT